MLFPIICLFHFLFFFFFLLFKYRVCIISGIEKKVDTLKGSLFVLKLIPGTNFNQTGNPLHQREVQTKHWLYEKQNKKNPKWTKTHVVSSNLLCTKKKEMLKLVPEVPFCTNIGSNPEMNIEPYFLHSLNEPYQIVSPLKIILKLSHKKEQA